MEKIVCKGVFIMKAFITIFAALVLIGTVVAGKIHWNREAVNQSSHSAVAATETSGTEEDSWKQHTANLPKAVVQKLEQAKTSGKPMKLVIVGSQATSEYDSAWPAKLEKALRKAYGQDAVDVKVLSYPDYTTLSFVEQDAYKDVVREKPDVLLFEPFLFNDNGVVGITHTLENLDVIMTDINKEVKGMVTILQPSQPIYHAVNYPKEEKELQAFAKEKGFEYANHWKAWPDAQSDKLLDYLSNEKRKPTQKGNDVWSQYLQTYFTGSK